MFNILQVAHIKIKSKIANGTVDAAERHDLGEFPHPFDCARKTMSRHALSCRVRVTGDSWLACMLDFSKKPETA